ncbi:hypothetical protein Tco_0453194 [Tanacetum coccineum]
MNVSLIPTTIIDKDHPKDQIIGDLNSAIQTRRMTKISDEHAMKFDFATVKTASTPIETNKVLVKDEEAEAIDVHLYRSMIGSLMYLTASKPDIMFVVCVCARFQVTPKASHIHNVKRIFRYLKGQPTLGLWYPRDSPFDLEAFSDSDYARASLDRKSTIGEYVAAANCYGQFWNMPLSKIINYVKQIHDIVDGKAVGHIRIISESDLLFNDEYGYLDDLTNFVTPTTHDSPLSGGNTPGCDEGRMELIQELMETCSSLTKRVLSLEEAKTAQDRVITDLKFEGQEVEKKRKARTPQPMKRRLFQGRVETSTDKILEESSKKQKLEEDNDAEKEELEICMDASSKDVDGSSKNYKIFSEMLDDFDRQDVIDLHRLLGVKKVVGVGWDSSGVYRTIDITGGNYSHDDGIRKKPLTQEMLSRMLNRRLEVDYESEMAFELLRFTRSQLQK